MKKILILVLVCISCISAQQGSVSRGVNYLSRFIASDYFDSLKLKCSDLQLTDSIYNRAVEFYNGNIADALLALTFATVPYKKVPIQVPLFKTIIKYPLISDCDSVFCLKNKHLPSRLFYDTPADEYGDRDKLAHFFGSAFISYSSNVFDLGDLIGYFVEAFEETFKVQSKIDNRDLFTNSLGNIFGESLKSRKELSPSRILLMPMLNLIIL